MAATHIIAGTESGDVLSVPVTSGKIGDPMHITATSNPLGLKLGSPGGVAVEWVLVHPSSTWLYAFVSYWDKAPAELVTFALSAADPVMRERSRTSTLGFQAAHALFLPSTGSPRAIAVAHYHSGTVTLFGIPVHDPGQPKISTAVALPDASGKPRAIPEAPAFKEPPFNSGEPFAHGLALHSGWLVVADAGTNSIVSYKLDERRGDYHLPDLPIASPIAAPPQTHGPAGQDVVVRKVGHRPRHIVFAGEEALVVLHECANACTLHSFDVDTGKASAALQVIQSSPFSASRLWCGVGSAIASWLPLPFALLPALPYGVAAASEIAVHEASRRIVTSTRVFGLRKFLGGPAGNAYLRVFAVAGGGAGARLAVVQDIELPPGTGNPRHFAFVKGLSSASPSAESLLVGIPGGLVVFDVSPVGILSFSSQTAFGDEATAALDVDCVCVASIS